MRRERRWIVLTTDGRHITMGRAVPPGNAEVAQAASALAALGLTGWLAMLEGSYWRRLRRPTLTPIRPLAGAAAPDWPAAVDAFEAARLVATSSKPRPSPSSTA